MAVAISSQNINVDTLSNLKFDGQYYLSKSGDVKEASGWMRFKCWLGCSGARQKVANLINTVKEALLESAGMEKGAQDAKLEEEIGTIKRDRMVSGTDLQKLAKTFNAAHTNEVAKKTAERIIAAKATELAAAKQGSHHLGNESRAGLRKLIEHCLKRHKTDSVPIAKGADSEWRLNRGVFDSALDTTLAYVSMEIDSILKGMKKELGDRPLVLDEKRAQKIIDELYTPDGKRKVES